MFLFVSHLGEHKVRPYNKTLNFLSIKLDWVLKGKNPTTFYPPLPLPGGDFLIPLLRGVRGCVIWYYEKL